MRRLLAPLLCFMVGTLGAAYGEEALVDPTRPATAAPAGPRKAEAVAVHVEAIMSRPNGCVAIVNGQLVRTGDRLGNISIEGITPDGVRYVQGGRTHFSRLSSDTPIVVRRASVITKDLP